MQDILIEVLDDVPTLHQHTITRKGMENLAWWGIEGDVALAADIDGGLQVSILGTICIDLPIGCGNPVRSNRVTYMRIIIHRAARPPGKEPVAIDRDLHVELREKLRCGTGRDRASLNVLRGRRDIARSADCCQPLPGAVGIDIEGVDREGSVRRAQARPTIYLSDSLSREVKIRTLEETVRLETRTKTLNPKWYEGMLKHGFRGVAEIENHVANTFGWSATADAVDDWIYSEVANTFLFDESMLERLRDLNPHSAHALVRRLLEANGRGYWDVDAETLEKLHGISRSLEDQMEGVA